jgi:hypothetical protein
LEPHVFGTLVGARWDLPTLVVEAASRIEFYNAGRRHVHKVPFPVEVAERRGKDGGTD